MKNENHSQHASPPEVGVEPQSEGAQVLCPVCKRAQPFTRAVLAGLPLGSICTCAIEQRVMERALKATQRRYVGEGH